MTLKPGVDLMWTLAAEPTAFKICEEHRPDAILATGPPFAVFVLAKTLSHFFKIPYVIDYRDEWSLHPEKIQRVAQMPIARLKYRKEQKIEENLLEDASAIIWNTLRFEEEASRKFAINKGRSFVISNGFDIDEHRGLSRRKDGGSKICVVHMGSIDHPSMGAAFIVPGLQALARRTNRRIHLLLQGQLNDSLVGGFEKKWDLVDVELSGYSPPSKALEKLYAADLALLIEEQIPGKDRYQNLKLFDYLASRVPILGMGYPQGSISQVLEETGAGKMVSYGDFEEVGKIGAVLLQTDLESQAEEYNWDFLSERLENLLFSLVKAKR
ncbi:MAG: glycosyltransferase family 4 protein [Deltaproteobacteria bacterium]|nr:glycosyltransferase family 4 protein [Deltaproteobacteria bacterium]